jgi:hypothetical protein
MKTDSESEKFGYVLNFTSVFIVRSGNEYEEYSLLSQADLLLVPEDVRGGLLEIWLRRLARELN